MKRALIAVSALALLGACAQQPGGETSQAAGVGIGAVTGAAIGAGLGLLVGGDDRRNAAVGAGIGAVAGGAVGAYLTRQEADLNEDLAGTGATVVNTGDQLIVTLPENVTFAVDSATIQPRFTDTLREFAFTLQTYPSTLIDVVGHTDSTGSAAYNQRLSEARATSVLEFLAAEGVKRERMVAVGRGESQPVASNATVQGRAANRRVEIVITPVT